MDENKDVSQNFLIRQMQIDDLAAVFHLGEKLFTLKEYPTLYRTWDEYEVIDYYTGNPEYCLVAESGGEFAGFLLGSIIDKRNSYRKYGYLVWFGVDEKFQGTGVSTMLYERYREIMIEEDVRMLMVDTSADNERALAFFTARGFSSPKDHVYLTLKLTEKKKSQ
jgi:ribosomal protein S18 acetylase RimI-like enzyme